MVGHGEGGWLVNGSMVGVGWELSSELNVGDFGFVCTVRSTVINVTCCDWVSSLGMLECSSVRVLLLWGVRQR